MRQEVTLRLNCIESRDYPSTVVLQIHPYHLKITSDENLFQISNLQEETDEKILVSHAIPKIGSFKFTFKGF